MTGSDNFCLRLNELEGNTKIYWQELQKETNFCDVTLACEDKQIETHKLIISSCSPVLANILKLNQTPHPVIYLRRVKYKDLQNLLNFMYQGEANVSEEDFPSFLEIAEDLNIRGLCEGNLGSSKSIEEGFSQGAHESTYPSEDRKRTWNESLENDNFNIESVDEKHFNNDTVINTLITPKNKTINQVNDRNSKQNTISTVAVHDAGESYQCDLCDYKTKRLFNLNTHTKSIHEGERHPCLQCNFKGKQSSQLRHHVKIVHEGVRYPCDQCDYKATAKFLLRSHTLKVHQ